VPVFVKKRNLMGLLEVKEIFKLRHDCTPCLLTPDKIDLAADAAFSPRVWIDDFWKGTRGAGS
jgi:hypothetical protein